MSEPKVTSVTTAGGGRRTPEGNGEPAAAQTGHQARSSQVADRRTSRVPARLRAALPPAVVLVILVALPFYVPAEWLGAGQYVMIGVVGAVGMTLVAGQAGQLSLAHPFFLLAGGTTYVILAGSSSRAGLNSVLSLGWPPVLALLGAVAVSAGLGLTLAPIAGRLKGIYFGIATMTFVFIGFYLAQRFPRLTGGSATGRSAEPFAILGLEFSNRGELVVFGVPLMAEERLWYLFLALTVIAYVMARGAVPNRIGRSWRAVRDNEIAAAVMGVEVGRVKAGAFAVSAAYAGLAGVMTVLWLGMLKPDDSEVGTYGFNVSVAFLAMVVIGGLGSVTGAVVGAVVVYGLPQFLTLLLTDQGVDGFGAGFTPTSVSAYIYGTAVVVFILFEPGGLAVLATRVRRGAARFLRPSRVPATDVPAAATKRSRAS